MTNEIGGTAFGLCGLTTAAKEKRNTCSVRWTGKKTSRSSTIVKKLNYNPREISSQLLRASKTRSATEVLTRAKSKLGNLRRCQGTGQYDSGELRIAIAHAQKMVRCAQVKVRNLKEEDQSETRDKRKNSLKGQQKKMLEASKLRQKRCRHRNQERAKIMQADAEYMQEKRRYDSESNRYCNGVELELSAAAMQMNELQITASTLTAAEEHKLEEEIEQQIEMELQIQEAALSMDGGSLTAPSAGSGADAALTESIDLVI